MMKKGIFLIVLVWMLFAFLCLFVRGSWAMSSRKAWGKPAIPKGSPVSYQIWRDRSGWHIRWTSAIKVRHFKGKVFSPDGEVALIRKVDKERGDVIRKKGGVVVFNAYTRGGWDGFDFVVYGRQIVFDLQIGGRYLPQRVFVGANAINPSRLPFCIYKASPPRGYYRPPKPHPGAIWIPGHYGPGGRWVPGHWL